MHTACGDTAAAAAAAAAAAKSGRPAQAEGVKAAEAGECLDIRSAQAQKRA